MNRQCKLKNQSVWLQYGPVTYFDAVRRFAKDMALMPNRIHIVETRDGDHPEEPIGEFQVIPRTNIEILNPRQGADHGEEAEQTTRAHQTQIQGPTDSSGWPTVCEHERSESV